MAEAVVKFESEAVLDTVESNGRESCDSETDVCVCTEYVSLDTRESVGESSKLGGSSKFGVVTSLCLPLLLSLLLDLPPASEAAESLSLSLRNMLLTLPMNVGALGFKLLGIDLVRPGGRDPITPTWLADVCGLRRSASSKISSSAFASVVVILADGPVREGRLDPLLEAHRFSPLGDHGPFLSWGPQIDELSVDGRGKSVDVTEAGRGCSMSRSSPVSPEDPPALRARNRAAENCVEEIAPSGPIEFLLISPKPQLALRLLTNSVSSVPRGKDWL